jgi:hypothetical protein
MTEVFGTDTEIEQGGSLPTQPIVETSILSAISRGAGAISNVLSNRSPNKEPVGNILSQYDKAIADLDSMELGPTQRREKLKEIERRINQRGFNAVGGTFTNIFTDYKNVGKVKIHEQDGDIFEERADGSFVQIELSPQEESSKTISNNITFVNANLEKFVAIGTPLLDLNAGTVDNPASFQNVITARLHRDLVDTRKDIANIEHLESSTSPSVDTGEALTELRTRGKRQTYNNMLNVLNLFYSPEIQSKVKDPKNKMEASDIVAVANALRDDIISFNDGNGATREYEIDNFDLRTKANSMIKDIEDFYTNIKNKPSNILARERGISDAKAAIERNKHYMNLDPNMKRLTESARGAQAAANIIQAIYTVNSAGDLEILKATGVTKSELMDTITMTVASDTNTVDRSRRLFKRKEILKTALDAKEILDVIQNGIKSTTGISLNAPGGYTMIRGDLEKYIPIYKHEMDKLVKAGQMKESTAVAYKDRIDLIMDSINNVVSVAGYSPQEWDKIVADWRAEGDNTNAR